MSEESVESEMWDNRNKNGWQKEEKKNPESTNKIHVETCDTREEEKRKDQTRHRERKKKFMRKHRGKKKDESLEIFPWKKVVQTRRK